MSGIEKICYLSTKLGPNKLGRIIWLRKIVQTIWYLFHYLAPKLGQNRPAYWFFIQNKFLFKLKKCWIMLNNVKYWLFRVVFCNFRANLKSKPNSLITFWAESCQMVCFHSYCFVSLKFKSPLFDLFGFVQETEVKELIQGARWSSGRARYNIWKDSSFFPRTRVRGSNPAASEIFFRKILSWSFLGGPANRRLGKSRVSVGREVSKDGDDRNGFICIVLYCHCWTVKRVDNKIKRAPLRGANTKKKKKKKITPKNKIKK